MAALDREIRRRPRGTAAEVSRVLGMHRGWWHDCQRRQRPITTTQFETIAKHLGLDVPALACDAFGSEPGLHRPPGPASEIAKRAEERDRLGNEGVVGRDFVKELEKLAHNQPTRVFELASWGVDRIKLVLLPSLLGVAASAARRKFDLDQAESLLYYGILISSRRGLNAARLYQRLAYVYGDRGLFERSLRLSRQASHLYQSRGDREGSSRVLVDQGIWLYRSRKFESATHLMELALEQLSQDDKENRFAALQYLGLIQARLNDSSAATRAFDKAELLARNNSLPSSYLVKLGWSRARVASRDGRLSTAISLLSVAFRFFCVHHPAEAALVACELVDAQLRCGKLAEAVSTIDEATALVEPLREYELVSEALRLLLVARTTGIKLEAVGRARELILSARHKPAQWPLPTEGG